MFAGNGKKHLILSEVGITVGGYMIRFPSVKK